MPVIIEIALRALALTVTIVALTRVHGLRSFSKMSGFDFAVTVSIGSVLAGGVTTLSTPWWHFALALVALFAVQMAAAQLRTRSDLVQRVVDNDPMLVMSNGKEIPENLRRAGMTRADLRAKLREANAYVSGSVHAVVVESTGDVSVLHAAKENADPDDDLLDGLRR